ncbi:hypothetical protein KC622_02415 [Candidatus Dojkabacteria bacterium]|uniref:DUF11 domain-containing protein n=1 Tax=Candidatus Dojkabacteria bacterium TaxID=2099670 RepID=A0A955HY41_9BACT|nr:hypothetical protein [Candidatus Dojkabacteria bacterium]
MSINISRKKGLILILVLVVVIGASAFAVWYLNKPQEQVAPTDSSAGSCRDGCAICPEPGRQECAPDGTLQECFVETLCTGETKWCWQQQPGTCNPDNPPPGAGSENCDSCTGSCNSGGCTVTCDEYTNPFNCGYTPGTFYCRGQSQSACGDQHGSYIGGSAGDIKVGQNVELTLPDGSGTFTTSTWCTTIQADSNAPNSAAVVVYVGDNGETCVEGTGCNPDDLDWDCANAPEPVTVSGSVYCQDTGGEAYPIKDAEVYIHDSVVSDCPAGEGLDGESGVCQKTVKTDANGNFTLTVPFRDQGGTYSNDVDVRISALSAGTLSTGKPYSELIPSSSSAVTAQGFAINCSDNNASGCNPSAENADLVCQNKSFDNTSGSYSYCGLTEGKNITGLDFKFTNCTDNAPAACNASCTDDSDCNSGYCDPTSKSCRNESCSTETDCVCPVEKVSCNESCTANSDCTTGYCDGTSGMCRDASCSDETDCVCPSTNPEWEISKTADVTCPTDEKYADVDYTITVKNIGDAAGTLNKIVDTLDADAQENWVLSGKVTPEGSVAENVLTWTLDVDTSNFDPAESKTFTYTLRVPSDNYGSIDNSAEAFPAEGDTFKIEKSVSVKCDIPKEKKAEPLPDTGITDSPWLKLGVIGVLLVLSGVYIYSEKADSLLLRAIYSNERLNHKRKVFEKSIDKSKE